jgi:hypothetical protein
MPNLNEVYNLLEPAKNLAVKTVENQSTNDIIQQVLKQHKKNTNEAKKIAHLFYAGNLHATCQNIWNFLKYQVPYEVEPSQKQTTKTIARILYDAKNNKGNDCKHYASFTGSILSALGYSNDFVYRFAGYSNYHNTPTHVYCVAKDSEGKIYIDAVINGFDLEKPYKIKIDKKPNMSLYSLSGVDDTLVLDPSINGVFSKVKNAAKKVAAPLKKAATAIKNTALSAGLAVPRNAFLILIRFNVHGWATGMQKLSFDDLKWWSQLGGDRTALQKVVTEGAKKKRILGLADDDVLVPEMVNSVGEVVTVTTALATAAPILAKLTTVLAKAEKLSNSVEKIKGKADKTKDAIQKAKDGFKKITGKDVEDIIFKKEQNKESNKNSLTPADFSKPTDAEAEKVARALVESNKKAPMDKKIIIIGGAAALAALLLLKKK